MKPQYYIKSVVFTILVLTLSTLTAQQTPVFDEVTIDSKMNGAFITLFSTTPVLEHNVTGWHTETGWFYVTILNAVTDTTRIRDAELTDPVSDIEITNYPESTQLAFKIEKEVESFDIYTSDSPAGLLISLKAEYYHFTAFSTGFSFMLSYIVPVAVFALILSLAYSLHGREIGNRIPDRLQKMRLHLCLG